MKEVKGKVVADDFVNGFLKASLRGCRWGVHCNEPAIVEV
jgi:hypothetical protein